MGFFITKKDVQSLIEISVKEFDNKFKDVVSKKQLEDFRKDIEQKISNSMISNVTTGSYFVDGDVINIELGENIFKISPKVFDVTTSTTTSTSTTKTLPIGELENIPLQDFGIVGDKSYQLDIPRTIYPPTKEMWDNIVVDIIDDKFLKVTLDTRGWTFTNPPLFKVEVSNKWLTKEELEKIDFSNQSGNDILLYCGHISGDKMRVGWTFVHIKGNKDSKVPQYVVRDSSKRMPQFFRNFPDVKVNKSKKNIIQFHQLDENSDKVSEKYFDKGFTVARSEDISKTFFADYDYWCYNNGGKRWEEFSNGAIDGFEDAHKYNMNWIKKTPFNKLLSIFEENIIRPANGHPFALLDWEAFGWMPDDKEIINRLGTLFYKFYEYNKVKVATYIDAMPFDCRYNSSISKDEMERMNKMYNQPLSEIAIGFFKHDFDLLDSNGNKTGERKHMGDYILALSGGYMYKISDTNLYGTIQQLELCKIHNIESLTINWGLIESIDSSDYYTHIKFFKKNNGFTFLSDVKPPTPCSHLENITTVSNLFAGGFYGWDEPLPFEEGFEHHGGHVKNDENTQYLWNDFNPKNLGTYHYNAQIGYDYVARSLNTLSKIGDYLNDLEGFEKVPFYIGSTLYEGDKLLPASAEFYKLPLVRIKKHPSKKELIIFAVNHHLEHYEKQVIKVVIDDKLQEIELNGQFSNLQKFKIK